MENLNNKLSPPKIRSRRNSLQPIDRHINDINIGGSVYINAGIDSTWFVKSFFSREINIFEKRGEKSELEIFFVFSDRLVIIKKSKYAVTS
jgi:hypothetical protein